MSSSWHWFIAIFTVVNIIACLWLIVWTTRQGDAEKGAMDTLDHSWDGDLQERNNPLPRWWLFLFVGTIIWGFGYLAWYPGLGAFAGTSKWTSVDQYLAERERIDAVYQQKFSQLASLDYDALGQHAEGMEIAGRLYGANCATCHGSDARGAVGFPNLADGDWLWGGTAQAVRHTITHGRVAAMPPWGAALGDDGVKATVAYVRSLSGATVEPALAEQGKTHYQTLCMACHGPTGTGMQALGAPNLTDSVWLYGGDVDTLTATISNGRNGNMPAHNALLSDDEITLLTAYVLSLSDTGASGGGGGGSAGGGSR